MSDLLHQALDMLAAGKAAAEIASKLGVHTRTVYKWAARHKPDPTPPADAPEGYNQARALTRLINRELLALENGAGSAALERLVKLGKLATALGLKLAVTAQPYDEGMRQKLMDKINTIAERLAADDGHNAPEENPPALPDARPEGLEPPEIPGDARHCPETGPATESAGPDPDAEARKLAGDARLPPLPPTNPTFAVIPPKGEPKWNW